MTIPDSVTAVGQETFSRYSGLTNMTSLKDECKWLIAKAIIVANSCVELDDLMVE